VEILRRDRRAAVLVAAGLALAVVAAFMLLRHDSGKDSPGDGVTGSTAPGTTGGGVVLPKGKKARAGDRAAGHAPKGGGGASVSGRADGFGIDGLPGHSLSAELPVIRIQLSVDSAEPIGVVGYVVPTSRDHTSGKATGVGRHWSLSTTGYGRPDYARIFVGAGPSGSPVTCTVRINGVITEQRSTKGPYGQMMCQG
jgi:hypothetical protein